MSQAARRVPVALVVALVVALALLAGLAGPARAADQLTLDHRADSMGPVVVDQSGNGYVAWLHKVGAGDVDMFCKLPAGAPKCSHPLTRSPALRGCPLWAMLGSNQRPPPCRDGALPAELIAREAPKCIDPADPAGGRVDSPA